MPPLIWIATVRFSLVAYTFRYRQYTKQRVIIANGYYAPALG